MRVRRCAFDVGGLR